MNRFSEQGENYKVVEAEGVVARNQLLSVLANEIRSGLGADVFIKQMDINGKVSRNPAEWPEKFRRQKLPWEAKK